MCGSSYKAVLLYINNTKVSTKIRKKKSKQSIQHIQEILYIQGRWCFHIFLLSNDLINAASRRPTTFKACCVAEMPSLVSTDYPKSRDDLRVASDKHVVLWGEGRQSAHQIFLFVAVACTSFCHSPHTYCRQTISAIFYSVYSAPAP